jgi:threonine synthase
MAPASFREILLEGLAPDGGLAMPQSCPQVDRATLARWRGLDYRGLAYEILSLFIDDIRPRCARSSNAPTGRRCSDPRR